MFERVLHYSINTDNKTMGTLAKQSSTPVTCPMHFAWNASSHCVGLRSPKPVIFFQFFLALAEPLAITSTAAWLKEG